jgi:hypothetical protein
MCGCTRFADPSQLFFDHLERGASRYRHRSVALPQLVGRRRSAKVVVMGWVIACSSPTA